MATTDDKTFTVRFPADLTARVTAQAKADGLSRTAWLEAAARAQLESAPAAPATAFTLSKKRRAPEPESDDKRSRVYHREVSGCPHKYKDTTGRCLACGYKR